MDTDVPITKCIDDRLGRVGIARHIADMLIGAPADHSIVFGLSGSWGSGKTSVLNMVGELLSEASDPPVVVRFDPWSYPAGSDLVTPFLTSLASEIRKYNRRIRTPSATGYYEVAAQARPMMMLAETCIIGGTMDGYSHLSIAEREDIMVRWKGHEGVSQIARELHRDKSTISREIRRNGWQGPAGRRYRASTAQGKADRRRLRCRRPRLMDEPERRSLVVRLMRDEHWSPEEISGRISEERPDLAVSDSAIYRAVESGSLDCELPGHRKAARLLRHHGKRRHRKGSQERRGKVRITHDISERPEEASSRSRTGDWEGDTVAGRQGGACLVTQVDRMSGYLVGGKAARKAHAEVNEATERALEGEAVHTVTLDRGKEFSDAEGLQEALGAPVYFCHPHHPWERGTNENTNGLLRDWFPKGESLDDVSDSEVQEVYDSLNRRPRKRLKWKCPWEVYHHQSLHLL